MSDILEFISNSKEELNKKIVEKIEDWLYYILNEVYIAEEVTSIWIGFLNPSKTIEPILAVGSKGPVLELQYNKNNDTRDKDLSLTAIKSGNTQINTNGNSIAIPIKNPKGEIIGVFNILIDSQKNFNEEKITHLNNIIEEIKPLLVKMYIID